MSEQSKKRVCWRRLLIPAAVFISGSLLFLFLFDLFCPPQARAPGMLINRLWAFLLVAPTGVVLLLVGTHFLQHKPALARTRKVLQLLAFGLGLLWAVPLGVMLHEGFVYTPIKFTYLIHRVEAASTPEEERVAFRLAARWGRVWELNRVERKYAPARAQHLDAPRILEVEWLETWPNGVPFRAYRILLDVRNMTVFDDL